MYMNIYKQTQENSECMCNSTPFPPVPPDTIPNYDHLAFKPVNLNVDHHTRYKI